MTSNNSSPTTGESLALGRASKAKVVKYLADETCTMTDSSFTDFIHNCFPAPEEAEAAVHEPAGVEETYNANEGTNEDAGADADAVPLGGDAKELAATLKE